MPVRPVDDKPSDTLVVVSGEGFWTGSSTLPHLHQPAAPPRGAVTRRVTVARLAALSLQVPDPENPSTSVRLRTPSVNPNDIEPVVRPREAGWNDTAVPQLSPGWRSVPVTTYWKQSFVVPSTAQLKSPPAPVIDVTSNAAFVPFVIQNDEVDVVPTATRPNASVFGVALTEPMESRAEATPAVAARRPAARARARARRVPALTVFLHSSGVSSATS
jgi:hypothetical protein